MRKPGKDPAAQHETIPLSKIPKAVLAEAVVIGPRGAIRQRSPHDRHLAKKIKVMIVDDERYVAETSAQLLGTFGYECYAVYNADDALACAESFTPDIVLSDVIMEGTNGVELCQEIKQMLPECRILLLSGHVPTAYTLMQDANKQGCNFELLAKPVRPDELVAKIENLFGGAYSPGGTRVHA